MDKAFAMLAMDTLEVARTRPSYLKAKGEMPRFCNGVVEYVDTGEGNSVRATGLACGEEGKICVYLGI